MGKIHFISRLEPVLKSGEYTINLKQKVSNKAGLTPVFDETYTIDKKVLVAGERFRLEAPEIHIVFPPKNNIGDHSNALPQVVLNRATLPWERDTMKENEKVPWMMVMVFYESELASDQVKLLQSEKVSQWVHFGGTSTAGKIVLPKEVGQDENELIDVLRIDKNLAEKIIPSAQDLILMTSVRDNDSDNNVISSQWATCFANRLPAIGEKSYAFLVSMEHRYQPDGSFDKTNGAVGEDFIFTCLTKWSFSCPDEQEFEWNVSTEQKLTNKDLSKLKIQETPPITVGTYLKEKLAEGILYRGVEVFKGVVPELFTSKYLSETNRQAIINCLTVPTKTFEGILNKVTKGNFKFDVPGLQSDEYAQPYLKRSAVLLPHHLRGSQETVSWYHGPFISGENKQNLDSSILPILSSDSLYQYDESINMLDVSYATAWEFGRLLMLDNSKMAKNLFAWKQLNVAKLLEAEQNIAKDYLPFTDSGFEASTLGETLEKWFEGLSELHGVPFNYLVPDERLLPNESIRFFKIDNQWIECLIDGAFSIGRVTKNDHSKDHHFRKIGLAPTTNAYEVTGFLLRSEAVSGWPSLEVDGYANKQAPDSFDKTPLEILRKERISPNILLCLFDGKVETVDLHLKAESLHMGYESPNEENDKYHKVIKDPTSGKETSTTADIVWKHSDDRIINVSEQAKNIGSKLDKELNTGQFSLEMIVGVPRVRFNLIG